MKIAPVLTAVMTIFALNASATSIAQGVCFHVDRAGVRDTVGKIQLNKNNIRIDWDVDDFTEASKESGIVRDFKQTRNEISGEAIMDRAEGGGTVLLSITQTQFQFWELNAQRQPLTANPEIRLRVECPQQASPLELAD